MTDTFITRDLENFQNMLERAEIEFDESTDGCKSVITLVSTTTDGELVFEFIDGELVSIV